MGVLAAVFANPGHVSFNVTRIGGAAVKGRSKELDEAVPSVNELFEFAIDPATKGTGLKTCQVRLERVAGDV